MHFDKSKPDTIPTDLSKERFDLIFCRNVLIYFNDKLQKLTLERFFERLKPGGVGVKKWHLLY